MALTKDLAMKIRAEMSEDIYRQLPNHLKEEMTIKSLSELSYRTEYKKDEVWKKRNKEFIDALVARSDREDQIRVNLRNE